MRVLLGSDSYAPLINGAGRFVQRLAEGLAGRGHEVHVAAPSGDGTLSVEEHAGVVVHRIRSVRYRLHPDLRVCLPWHAKPATRALVEELMPDVVHVHSHMVVGRGLAAAARRHGIRLIATNHFMPENMIAFAPLPAAAFRPAAALAWRDLARVFRDAAVVTAPTQRAVDLLADRAKITGARPVSCGIDLDRFAPGRTGAGGRLDVPTILFVGRLDVEKRVDELISAFALLPDGTARLEIVGDGERRAELAALVDRLGVFDRVRFTGFVTDAELLAAYRRCDIFCMPGIAELQSLVTLEAMACGNPVVAANAMALPHLVHPDRNGFLFRPGDIVGLSQYLAVLCHDPALRGAMAAESLRIDRTHAVEATLDAFEGAYRPQPALARAA